MRNKQFVVEELSILDVGRQYLNDFLNLLLLDALPSKQFFELRDRDVCVFLSSNQPERILDVNQVIVRVLHFEYLDELLEGDFLFFSESTLTDVVKVFS